MLEQLLHYLKGTNHKIHEMYELTPGVFAVRDNFGRDAHGNLGDGRIVNWILYYDPKFITPMHPWKKWVEDHLSNLAKMSNICAIMYSQPEKSDTRLPPKTLGECVSFARERLCGTYEQFLWHQVPQPLEVPVELRMR